MELNPSYNFNLSRILPPYLGEVMERPRLLQTIAQSQDKKLLLILGQAAQGKSTLAACYVQQCGIPTAWVNLGPEDADAVNLYLLLMQSLNRALQEVNGVSLVACSTANT